MADLLLSWSLVDKGFCVAFELSGCNFESLHLPDILLLSCSFIFICRSNSISAYSMIKHQSVRQIYFTQNPKYYLVFFLLNPRRFFPGPRRCGVLIYRNATLSEKRLILFTVRARIDSAEIAYMLVLPFKLLLQVIFFRLIRFRRADRRIIYATSNERFKLSLDPLQSNQFIY